MNLELFPCSGGMAEGFRRAGVTFDFSVDYSKDACDSYEHNLGHRPLCMDVEDFARMVRYGWRPVGPRTMHVNGIDHSWPIEGRVNLLVADPPCTPWSRAGKRMGIEDERDCLRVTAELIKLLRPRAYLIGNVPGLQDATQWHVVQDVIGGLADHGYCVRDYAQLDAANYGVPQNRVRPFWFGHLDGPCIRWPERTHAPPHQVATATLPGVRQLARWVTCRDALSHLPIDELGRSVRMRLRKKGHDGTRVGGDDTRCSEADRPARTVVAKQHRKGGQILLPAASVDELRRSFVPNGGDEPHRTVATTADQMLLEWPWDRPSTTVCSRDTIPPPGHHPESGSILSLPNAVVLSEKAASILQGFPDGWLFSGKTKDARWQQIGMAMPPGLAEPVARAVVEQMEAARGRAAKNNEG